MNKILKTLNTMTCNCNFPVWLGFYKCNKWKSVSWGFLKGNNILGIRLSNCMQATHSSVCLLSVPITPTYWKTIQLIVKRIAHITKKALKKWNIQLICQLVVFATNCNLLNRYNEVDIKLKWIVIAIHYFF